MAETSTTITVVTKNVFFDDEPTGNNDIVSLDVNYSVSIVTDGTTTIVEVMDSETPDKVIGMGTAKRRKGDRRRPEVGIALAMSRAFADAAQGVRKIADELLR